MEELDPLYLVIYQTASLSQRKKFFFSSPFLWVPGSSSHPARGRLNTLIFWRVYIRRFSPHASEISPHEKFPFKSMVLPLPRTFWVLSWHHVLAVDFVPFEAFTDAFTSLFRKKKVVGGGRRRGLEIPQQPEDALWIIQDAPGGIANTQHRRPGVTVNTLISGLRGKESWWKWWAHLPPETHA